MGNTLPLRTIYFDGLCQLCSREIDLFRRLVPDGSLVYVDIAADDFDPTAYGVDPVAVHKTMHVRDDEGELRTGLDALIAMWEVVPGFRWLAIFANLPLVRPVAQVGYALFAWVRPKLPKRKRVACETGRCQVG
jgi:predicted DCC family thiol-disulfide oxidoreductase YuxK